MAYTVRTLQGSDLRKMSIRDDPKNVTKKEALRAIDRLGKIQTITKINEPTQRVYVVTLAR